MAQRFAGRSAWLCHVTPLVQDHGRAAGKQPHPEQFSLLLAAALSLSCLIHAPTPGTRGTAKERGLGHNVLHHYVPNSTPSF